MNKVSYPRVRVKAKKTLSGAPSNIFKMNYEAARDGRRAEGWARAAGQGPETAGVQGFEKLRKRTRFEARNNAIAARLVDVIVAETIGSGIKPHITSDQALADLWNKWIEQSDADGVQDFYGQQALVMRETVVAGEVFSRVRARRLSDGLPVPMQVQVLPAEYVPNNQTALGSFNARSGIIFSGPGQRSAYLFHKNHPGESETLTSNGHAIELTAIPAASVAHTFMVREAGQIRGEPWLTRALIKLHDLDAYTDAEMIRKKLAAMVAYFVEMPEREKKEVYVNENGETVDIDGNPVDPEEAYDLLPTVEPGATVALPPGAKMTQATATDVGGTFEVFIRQIMREICAAVSVPYEIATGDFGGMNDRLVRVNLLKFYALVRQWRQMVINSFCRPVWRAFVQNAFESGAWSPPAGTRLEDFLSVEWLGDAFPHIHPLQDIQADVAAVRAGFKTKEQVIRERGGNPEAVREGRRIELEKDDAANLIFDTDPRHTTNGGGRVDDPNDQSIDQILETARMVAKS